MISPRPNRLPFGVDSLFDWFTQKQQAISELASLETSKVSKWARTEAAAAKMVASSGPLSDYRQAPDLSLFWYAPTGPVDAYLKAAYWMGVAARIAQDSSIRAEAAQALAQAKFRMGAKVTPLSLLMSGPASIVEEAGNYVASKAMQRSPGSVRSQLEAIAKVLGVQVTQVAGAQARAWEQSIPGVIADTAFNTQQTLVKPTRWPWWLWAIVLGGAGVGLFVLLRHPRAAPVRQQARAIYQRVR